MQILNKKEVTQINNLIKLYNNQNNGASERVTAMTMEDYSQISMLLEQIAYCINDIDLHDKKVNKI